ncbi:hypothetical protein JHK82_035824 [Glycine max]|nr:hypothetical protein JHK82_035824 [Glycine max]
MLSFKLQSENGYSLGCGCGCLTQCLWLCGCGCLTRCLWLCGCLVWAWPLVVVGVGFRPHE